MVGRPAFGVGGWVVCRVSCVDASVPSQHRLRSDNQECPRPAPSVLGIAQDAKDRAVAFNESRTVDLTVQHEDLVSGARISASRESPVAKTHPIRVRTRRASEGAGLQVVDDTDLEDHLASSGSTGG